jgi:hypothetical protein
MHGGDILPVDAGQEKSELAVHVFDSTAKHVRLGNVLAARLGPWLGKSHGDVEMNVYYLTAGLIAELDVKAADLELFLKSQKVLEQADQLKLINEEELKHLHVKECWDVDVAQPPLGHYSQSLCGGDQAKTMPAEVLALQSSSLPVRTDLRLQKAG